jgi:hypothetical protein
MRAAHTHDHLARAAYIPASGMTIHFECGILLCRRVRDFLEATRASHPDLHWYESHGWITREFTIGGDATTITAVANALAEWARVNQLDTFP